MRKRAGDDGIVFSMYAETNGQTEEETKRYGGKNECVHYGVRQQEEIDGLGQSDSRTGRAQRGEGFAARRSWLGLVRCGEFGRGSESRIGMWKEDGEVIQYGQSKDTFQH